MVWLRNVGKRRKYYEETSTKPVSTLLLDILTFAKGKTAIDLGCGVGIDTKELVKSGFQVTAVDVNPEVRDYFSTDDLKNIKLVIEPIEDFLFAPCDLVYAKSSLVFLCPRKFGKVIEEIKRSLNPNGVFAARLWGKKDSDNKSGKNYKYSFVSIENLKTIFRDYDILMMNEFEEDKVCADGRMKHWDFIDVIVRKND